MKNEEQNRWDCQSVTGQGISYFKQNRVGNRWLYEDGLLQDSRSINALKLRTNNIGIRTACTRAAPKMDKVCRLYKKVPET